METKLAVVEARRYDELKGLIRNGIQTLFSVGVALMEIRDSKLYREEFKTFEDFCNKEFGVSKQHAYRMIDAAAIKKSPIGDKIKTESQARALMGVPAEKREAVIKKAEASGAITAKSITEASKREEVTIELDRTGHRIPAGIIIEWHRAKRYEEILETLSKIKCLIEVGLKRDALELREISNPTVGHLKNAYADLKCIVPYSVCPTCNGRASGKCGLCRGRGFISEFRYKNCVPEKIRIIREGKKK